MDNFFVISIFNFTAALVCLTATIKMYSAVKKNPENIKIRYFFYSFIFITVYLFTAGLPVVIVKDAFSISVVTFLFVPFLLIGGMFLTLTAINFTKFKKYEKLYIYLFLFVVLLSSFLNFLGLKNTGKGFEEVERWFRPESNLVVYGMYIASIFIIISLFFTILFYFRFAKRHKKNDIAFGRSIMIAEGCLFFLLAVISNNIIGITPERFLTSNVVASIFYMTGALCFISSIVYQGKKKV
jgi:hypothetical protein